jgi:hypothetical protein
VRQIVCEVDPLRAIQKPILKKVTFQSIVPFDMRHMKDLEFWILIPIIESQAIFSNTYRKRPGHCCGYKTFAPPALTLSGGNCWSRIMIVSAPFVDILSSCQSDTKVLVVVLDAIICVLDIGKEYTTEGLRHPQLDKYDGIDKIRDLLEHVSNDVYGKRQLQSLRCILCG